MNTRHFRKINTDRWNNPAFRNLSDDAQLACMFVETHPHLLLFGAMRASLEGLAAEKGWEPERFRNAAGEVIAIGWLEVDTQACYVGLPLSLLDNKPQNPNVVKAWATALDEVPDCDYKVALVSRLRACLVQLHPSFKEAFEEAMLLKGSVKPSRKPSRKPSVKDPGGPLPNMDDVDGRGTMKMEREEPPRAARAAEAGKPTKAGGHPAVTAFCDAWAAKYGFFFFFFFFSAEVKDARRERA